MHLNVTALMTVRQVEMAAGALAGGPEAVISVFAGRIADTGRDPVPIMREAWARWPRIRSCQLLWASPREILNVGRPTNSASHHHGDARPAEEAVGLGRDLDDFSLDDRPDVPRRCPRCGFHLVMAMHDIDAPTGRLGPPLGRLRRGGAGQSGQRLPAVADPETAGSASCRFRRPRHRQRAGESWPSSCANCIRMSRCEAWKTARSGSIAAGRSRPLGASRSRSASVDLLAPVALEADEPPATHAVCSEVLEHVDEPAELICNATSLLARGARVVVTVPGGPRSAFDKHIGHRRHFTPDRLRGVLGDGGLEVERVLRAGFPFFNLYKLAVIVRGRRLIADVEGRSSDTSLSRAEAAVTTAFRRSFSLNRDDFPFGWQLAAVARVPGGGEETEQS